MKRIILAGLSSITLFFAAVSHADFTFYSNTQNSCASISGVWAGSGKVHHWMIRDCVYQGTGVVSTVDESGQFTLNISCDKSAGGLICPKHVETQLKGTCADGVVSITTGYGDLEGHFSSTSGNASGTVTVSPGISADVSVQFQR